MRIMETKSVTLRENTALVELSIYSGRTIDELTSKILTDLISINCIYDIPEECGETLETILSENDYSLEQFAVNFFKVSTPRIILILKGLQIWGLKNECVDCGCEMIYNDISERSECKNDVCGCSINTNYTPDPDAGRDDNIIHFTFSKN